MHRCTTQFIMCRLPDERLDVWISRHNYRQVNTGVCSAVNSSNQQDALTYSVLPCGVNTVRCVDGLHTGATLLLCCSQQHSGASGSSRMAVLLRQ